MIRIFPAEPVSRAIYAVLTSVAKIAAAGGDYRKIRFTFQEYFRRMSSEPTRWSQPFAALLGAYNAQLGFGLPSIGGKDSMSGTFDEESGKEIDVRRPWFPSRLTLQARRT